MNFVTEPCLWPDCIKWLWNFRQDCIFNSSKLFLSWYWNKKALLFTLYYWIWMSHFWFIYAIFLNQNISEDLQCSAVRAIKDTMFQVSHCRKRQVGQWTLSSSVMIKPGSYVLWLHLFKSLIKGAIFSNHCKHPIAVL